MSTDQHRVEYLPLDDVQPAPHNPRTHNLDGLRASISRFGFAAPALRDERTGLLVVGHGRTLALRAMRDAGETAPSGVQVDDDGRWLVPVTCGWRSRSDAEAAAYLVADNRQSELASWDNAGLGDLLTAIGESDPDLVGIAGYTDDDLAALLSTVAGGGDPDPPESLTDPDEVPGLAAQVHSDRGDLWLLGEHRLLCGDSTNPDDVDRVLDGMGEPGIVYTDPPYGINAVPRDGGASRGGRFRGKAGSGETIEPNIYAPVAGDDSTDVARDSFTLAITAYPAAMHVWWGGNHFAASAGLPDATCWLVWDKENTGDFADAELAWTNHHGPVRLLRHMWNGMLRASERGKRVHPTQKPVALAEWAFERVDPKKKHEVVLDLFGGSGSTLIAAHRTGRRCAMIEMEPPYVDVICRRFQEHTGIIPERVLEDGTTKPHDFTVAE